MQNIPFSTLCTPSDWARIENTYRLFSSFKTRKNKLLKQCKQHIHEKALTNTIDILYNFVPQFFREFEKNAGVYIKLIRTHFKHNPTIQDDWKNVVEKTAKRHKWTNETKQLHETFTKSKNKPNPFSDSYLEQLEIRKTKDRQNELRKRIIWALNEAYKKQNYIIYNTLTVNPENYNQVFKKGSKEFQKYIKSLDKITKGHSYFGIIEKGSKTSRLHIHTIHIFHDIPKDWKSDPNFGKITPYSRQIPQLWNFWTNGFSTPIAIRFNQFDAYSQLGWVWPTDKLGNPIDHTIPAQLANYLAKYLTKAYGGNRKEWKTKIKRNFGLNHLKEITSKMTTTNLIWTLKTIHHPRKLQNIIVPKMILKRLILKELLLRDTKPNNPEELNTRKDIIAHSRHLTLKTKASNLLNSEQCETLNMSNTDFFNALKEWKTLSSKFKEITFKPYQLKPKSI
jgi:hypothetical protein